MSLTVAQVAALPELGLIVRTEMAPTDREVKWVAVSELLDPTPWLEGGDLLLTTGMALVDDPSVTGDYVARLVDAEVSAIGFGVGLSHPEVLPSLIAAAEAAAVPVVEVPHPVPFVAVSKAVSRMLTAREYEESAASFEAQRRLIRAAMSDRAGSTDQIVAVLAKHVRGFCLHMDARGQVVAASPARAGDRAAELLAEVERLRPRGLLASSSVSSADENIIIVPIGVKGSAEGFLAVGSSRPTRAADQAVINVAVSLLSWEVTRPHVLDVGMDPWRRLLIASGMTVGLQPTMLDDLGLAALGPRHACAIVVRAVAGAAIEDATLSALARIPGVIGAREDAGVLGFAPVGTGGEVPSAVRDVADLPSVAAVGISSALDLTDAANVRQAVDQARRAAALGSGLRLFDDAPARGLASLIDASTTHAWALEYLSDLVGTPEGAELMDTLRAWLDQHGQVDAAAQQLGIHRHTVRHRLRRAEAVLGRSLDDPAVRADLYFALAAVC